MQIRANLPTNPKTALRELYDRRQQELEAGEDRYDKLASRAATAHTYGKVGLGALCAGLGTTVASSLLKTPLLQYTGIGVTAAGLAIFCPAMWIRDTANLDASFLRMDNNALAQCQQDLARELGIER